MTLGTNTDNHTKLIRKLKRLDRLIRRQATGTPPELAKKLESSKSTIYRLIKILKNNGAPISYCKHRKSFYYEESGNFIVSFQID
jgi:predicted DNA-binding transcriptional regulator YafY